MNKKFSVISVLILCALVARAQDVPPETNWDSDPLDVIEETKQAEPPQPTVPEFTELSEQGTTQDVPPPQAPVEQYAEPTAPAAEDPFATEAPPAPLQASPAAPAQAVSTPMATGSDPDFAKEAEFHRIYKTYNEQPTSVEEWEKAVNTRSAEVYQVQKKDTLWGISSTFFGDPQFWPKIWSLNNGSIQNPHEIDPKMNIQFFAGSMDDVPTLQLAANEEPAKDEVQVTPKPVARDIPKGVIPAPKKRTPVLTQFPPSLPIYRVGNPPPQPPAAISFDLPPMKFPTAPEFLSYYLTDSALQGVGRIAGTEMGTKTAGEYQYVFVEMNEGAGKDFVVQKNVARVKDPSVKEREAQMIEVQGEIELLDKVDDGKNVYRALVKKSILPIEVGAVLLPGKIPMFDPVPSALASGVHAKIIGGQFDSERRVLGANTLVFLDSGSNRGLQEGQTFEVYGNQRVRDDKTVAKVNDRAIGTLKIVKVSPTFATAYVLKSIDGIFVGDYVGKSGSQAFNSAPIIEDKNNSSGDELNFDSMDQPSSDKAAPDGGSADPDFDL